MNIIREFLYNKSFWRLEVV